MSFSLMDYDWYCDNCHEFLNDQSGFSDAEDTWTCTCCGYENDVTINNTEDAPDNDDYDDEEEIPEGCAACGGNYPYCKDGCPVFDDDD